METDVKSINKSSRNENNIEIYYKTQQLTVPLVF